MKEHRVDSMEMPGGGKTQVQPMQGEPSRHGSSGVLEAAPGKPRAQRFSLQAPLRYRETGADKWHCGETENISASGMLFTGDHFFAPDATIEVHLRMPLVTAGAAADMVCQCVVVRPARERKHPPKLAARILQYRFVRS